ncbi:MAG: amidohydrolase family protein [Methanobacteriota archaeon]|nr:MAG: amidohydrolase family protein [Euryarchaeota archaeon]
MSDSFNTLSHPGGRYLKLGILNGIVVTQNRNRDVFKGDLLVEDGVITKLGEFTERVDDSLDAEGCIVMPGLINCHTHVSMALMRGAADDLRLEEFLERTFAVDARRTAEDIEIGAELGCIEMARSGTTCFLDLYYSEDVIAKAVERLGLRAYLGWAILDEQHTTQKGSPIRNCERFIREHSDSQLIKPVVAPQGVYVCSDDTLIAAKELASRENTFCHYHLSETRHEVYEYKRQKGLRPVEHLAKIGFLTKGDVAAHCVWLTVNEVRELARSGVSAAHCPTSNMKLAVGGVAPLPEMFEEGGGVCLGTDGCSSNNSLDMFLEMKFAALQLKSSRWDASALPAQKALDLATIDAARSLGAEKEIGSLELGKRADIAVVDCRHSAMAPTTSDNAVANLVYASPSKAVRDTIVGGEFVLRGREIVGVDEEHIIDAATAAAQKLLSE